jgi:ribose transport system ATP-binding protein
MDQSQVALRMTGVSKAFPGTLAVDCVDFEAQAGEVHALMGENGAGKSTLMRILAGSYPDYSGQVEVQGRVVRLHSPAEAQACGIAMTYQELSLARPRSIAENVLAGRLPCGAGGWLNQRAMLAEARRCLERVGLDLDPRTPVAEISQHEAQLVEIARALGYGPSILVMDEPTSALSREEVDRLFEIILRLKRDGLAIIYISHHLPEVFQIADRVTVLRDGRRVGTYPIAEVTAPTLVEKMIGGAVSDLYATRATRPGAPLLQACGLSRYGFFHDVSFTLRKGEILGIAGLNGAGRTELGRALCGIDPLDEGALWLRGEELWLEGYEDAIRAGLAYLTEDRKTQGLALRLTVAENVLSAILRRLGWMGLYREGMGAARVPGMIGGLQVQPPDPDRETTQLSGGNQQKLLLAKWLATEPQVLVLDEPTRGVDVGAKAIIHRATAAIADRGCGVILISSDLPELVGLSDRILVLRQGHLIGELGGGECSPEEVLLAASGECPDLPPVDGAR